MAAEKRQCYHDEETAYFFIKDKLDGLTVEKNISIENELCDIYLNDKNERVIYDYKKIGIYSTEELAKQDLLVQLEIINLVQPGLLVLLVHKEILDPLGQQVQ